MKFGYSFDERGSCQVRCDEAAVVRFVFEHYVNEHKPMDVLSYKLPLEVSPGILGGNEWRRRHVLTILSDPNYAGVQATPTGFVPGRYPPIVPIELFIAAQVRRWRLAIPSLPKSQRWQTLPCAVATGLGLTRKAARGNAEYRCKTQIRVTLSTCINSFASAK